MGDQGATSITSQPPNPHEPSAAVTIPARRGPLAGGLGIIVIVVLLGVAGFSTFKLFTAPPEAPPTPQYVEAICAVTLKHFPHQREAGENYPFLSPFTNDRTAYPAERCYWTKDGKAKKEPTYVLLNEYIKKPGPSICPDCGRLVEPHNPPPPPELMAAAQAGTSTTPAAPAGGVNARQPRN
jgi:hypothetical protein